MWSPQIQGRPCPQRQYQMVALTTCRSQMVDSKRAARPELPSPACQPPARPTPAHPGPSVAGFSATTSSSPVTFCCLKIQSLCETFGKRHYKLPVGGPSWSRAAWGGRMLGRPVDMLSGPVSVSVGPHSGSGRPGENQHSPCEHAFWFFFLIEERLLRSVLLVSAV